MEAMQAIKDYYIAHNAVVMGNVQIEAGVNIWFNSVVRGDLSQVTFGRRVNVQDGCIVHTDTDAPQTIEEGVVIGHGAILHGRRICRPKPLCDLCAVQAECDYFNTVISKPRRATRPVRKARR